MRVGTTVNGATSSYLWDRQAAYPQLVDDGSFAYLHNDGPLAQIDGGGNRTYLLTNALHSVRGLVDGSGALVGTTDYAAFGALRTQTGTTSILGYSGEQYTAATDLLHLRARDLHPAIGRFLSADPVQPNAPGTQGYNRYAYAANNPTTWVDPSGYSVESGAGDDLSLLLLMNVMGTGLANYLECFLDERCKALQLVMNDLGSQGANLVEWSAENLYDALFSTYPHEPTPVSPADLVFSLALSNTPIWGDLYDLATAVTGYDFVTGQYLAGWERLVTLVGVIPILGVAGANMRYGLRNANEFMATVMNWRSTSGALPM